MPVTFLTFSVGSLALFGIPLLPGFISKWMLATAAMEAGSIVAYLGIGALLLSAALTAGYLLPITVNGLLPGADYDYERLVKREPGRLMMIRSISPRLNSATA